MVGSRISLSMGFVNFWAIAQVLTAVLVLIVSEDQLAAKWNPVMTVQEGSAKEVFSNLGWFQIWNNVWPFAVQLKIVSGSLST